MPAVGAVGGNLLARRPPAPSSAMLADVAVTEQAWA